MKIAITNGRVIDPANAIDAKRDVFIDGEHIVAVGRRPAGFEPARSINAKDCLVVPGFVELGARLREPGQEHKATIESELKAAAAGGFTSVCCLPDTDPVIDTPAVVELIHQRAKNVRGARVHCIGALTRGLGGDVLSEMQALKEIGCVGLSNAGHPIVDSSVLMNALAYAATLDLTVFIDVEDPWLGAQGVMHEGAMSTRLGLPGIADAGEVLALSRALVLVNKTGVRAHFRNLSAAASTPLIRSALRSMPTLSCDVAMTHLHLTDEAVENHNGLCHVRPPLRTANDLKALLKALNEHHIQVLSAQHEPHDADAKAAPFAASEAGISGFDTFVPLLLELVRNKHLSLMDAIRASAQFPAELVALGSGRLEKGAVADVTVIDPDKTWTASAAELLSSGKNTPFINHPMRGKTTHTIVGGRLVYGSAASGKK